MTVFAAFDGTTFAFSAFFTTDASGRAITTGAFVVTLFQGSAFAFNARTGSLTTTRVLKEPDVQVDDPPGPGQHDERGQEGDKVVKLLHIVSPVGWDYIS
jgi:hypothetical protein